MHRLPARPPLGRLSRAALLLLVSSWGCGGGSGSEPTKVKPPIQNLPARIIVVTAPKTTAEAGSNAGDLVVRVENLAGEGLAGKGVQFSQTSAPTGFVFSPWTATTDSSGLARTTVTYRTMAGTDELKVTTDGLSTPTLVPVTITPAPPAYVVVTPSALTLFGAGDTASFQVRVTDAFQNIRQEVTPVLRVSDSTAVSVTPPAAFGANGTVRALKGGVSVTIDATALNLLGRMTVGVYPNPRNVCGGLTPQPLFFGVPVVVADSVVCLAANPDNVRFYKLVVFNESPDGTASLGSTVTATNIELDRLEPSRIGTQPSLTRIATRPSPPRAPTLVRRARAPKLDVRFHQRLLERSRALRPLLGAARTARSLARAGSVGRIRGPSYALSGSAPSVPAVDSLIALNVSTDACTTADTRTFRVEAVGSKAIVLADTTNPTGGFSRADYQRFAARFDTLVYPLDVGNFDAPSDIDNNGHVAILFTKAVNELTPASSDAFVGGFFYARDLFPRAQSSTFQVCATSNEGEMFYMMVPDPSGAVNGNQFELGFVDTLTTSILAHEFQHLINAGRRMYVNTAASSFEETWLNEGLSHEAEELLFFHEAGYAPRSHLASRSILDSWAHFAPWVSDDASNFVNFYYFLSDPANHSPIDANDGIETRGATWAFLRFAVDTSFSSDAGVWNRFTNSTTTGLGTLSFALQRDPKVLLRDFAVTNMQAWGGHPSWNFGDVYTQVFLYVNDLPLPFGSLTEGTPVPVAARGGSATYYKFYVTPGVQAMLRFGSSGAPANSNLKFVLMPTIP